MSNWHIEWAWSPWWLAVALPAAALITYFFYFRGKHYTPGQRRILALLRFLALALLAVLLLRPLLEKEETRREKPLLLWLDDRSQSILAHDSAQVAAWYQKDLPPLLAPLKDRYRLKRYGFSGALADTDSGFTGRTTNLAAALRTAQGRHYGQAVGAAVLVSDGIYNRGADPRYAAGQFSYPLYTLGLGDTSARRDAALQLLSYNDIAYKGNRFPVEIPIQAKGYAGTQPELRVRRLRDGKVLFREDVKIDRASFFSLKKVFLQASETGVWRYAVELDTLAGEAQTNNNGRRFTVKVIRAQKKIALVAERPHPDLGAIKRALETVASYQVKLYQPAAELPADSLFDLYIYHDAGREVLRQQEDRPRPLLLIAYTSEALQAAAQVLPGQWENRGKGSESVQAVVQPDFAQFTLPEATQRALAEWPPLQTRYGRWRPATESRVLLRQKIGQVASDRPLWLFGRGTGQRYSLLLGGNVWRWRLYDYRQEGQHEQFDRLWQQAAQYLMAENIQERLQVEAPAQVARQESWSLQARLYNPAYELVNEVPLAMRLRREDGKTFRYRFSRRNGRYALEVKSLPAGHYRW
ncbi:MAG: hypothetical protein RI842_10430, partial [Schleiferiaceae bacterium]|nr:hypothetical protein [Schleiferiaceae bacterium]